MKAVDSSTTIRVPARTRDQLNALARRRGESVGDVVTELVQGADERALLDDAAAGWNRLAMDNEAAALYRTQSEALDAFNAPLPDH